MDIKSATYYQVIHNPEMGGPSILTPRKRHFAMSEDIFGWNNNRQLGVEGRDAATSI